MGDRFVGILDTGAEEPKSKARRYVVSGIALVLLLAAGMWYLLRYTTEKHTVERFMDAVIAGDTQKACQIWQTHPNFSCKDFASFWGPDGYYSPIKSYRVEISAYAPFPKPEEKIKFAQNREVQIWVERSNLALSFPPP
jgi:hypothetical protein